jgi:argininosuccinate lyase
MKLWKKSYELNKKIEKFTVGNDYLLDLNLVKYDCLASIAHAKMLTKINVITEKEKDKLVEKLNEIIKLNSEGKFEIKQEDEDCHTAIENYLTKEIGEIGKKIHSCRSRNDQVLAAIRLYEKEELNEIKNLVEEFVKSIDSIIDKNENGKIEIPGYTHMQKAMPTTVGKLLGSYKAAMKDNIMLIESTLKLIDQSPLGSAAGFGVPVFDIDKEMTAKELSFSKVMENEIYCQLSRGKFEAQILNIVSMIMFDLNKVATDLIMFSMKEFGFFSLPEELCTGSSIMPQKKNPDVLELVRAKYHYVLGEEFKVKSMISNLISGYNRDMQLTKEPLMSSINILKESIEIISLVVSGLIVNEEKCKEAMTDELYATKKAYKLVKEGTPFRDAYKKVSQEYKKDKL